MARQPWPRLAVPHFGEGSWQAATAAFPVRHLRDCSQGARPSSEHRSRTTAIGKTDWNRRQHRERASPWGAKSGEGVASVKEVTRYMVMWSESLVTPSACAP